MKARAAWKALGMGVTCYVSRVGTGTGAIPWNANLSPDQAPVRTTSPIGVTLAYRGWR